MSIKIKFAVILVIISIFTAAVLPSPNSAAARPSQQANSVLIISSLSIETPLVYIPVVRRPQGGLIWDMSVADYTAGRLQGTRWVNEGTNIGIAGHSTLKDGSPGIFYNLSQIQIGAIIEVHTDGAVYEYVVTSKSYVSPRNLSVLSRTSSERLTLITCSGEYDVFAGTYSSRLIVVAERVQ